MVKYAKAPIVEALLQLVFSEPLSERDAERAMRKLSGGYARTEENGDYQVEVRVATTGAHPAVTGHKRWWHLVSDDGADALFLRRENFTIVKRAPYSDWQDFFSRFRRDFEQLVKVVGHRKYARIGLRYVNRLDIPVDGKAPLDVKRWLNVYPNVPHSGMLPTLVNQVRFEYKEPELGATILVTTGYLDPALINHHSYLVDIDTIVTGEIPLRHDELFGLIERLRPIKNSAFEAIITEEARALIGGNR